MSKLLFTPLEGVLIVSDAGSATRVRGFYVPGLVENEFELLGDQKCQLHMLEMRLNSADGQEHNEPGHPHIRANLFGDWKTVLVTVKTQLQMPDFVLNRTSKDILKGVFGIVGYWNKMTNNGRMPAVLYYLITHRNDTPILPRNLSWNEFNDLPDCDPEDIHECDRIKAAGGYTSKGDALETGASLCYTFLPAPLILEGFRCGTDFRNDVRGHKKAIKAFLMCQDPREIEEIYVDDPIYNKHMGEWQDCVPRVVSVKTVEQPPFSLRDMPEGKNPGEVSEARIESLFLSETVRGRPNRCYRTRNPVTGELAEGDDIPENYAVDNLKILLRATRQQIVVPS